MTRKKYRGLRRLLAPVLAAASILPVAPAMAEETPPKRTFSLELYSPSKDLAKEHLHVFDRRLIISSDKWFFGAESNDGMDDGKEYGIVQRRFVLDDLVMTAGTRVDSEGLREVHFLTNMPFKKGAFGTLTGVSNRLVLFRPSFDSEQFSASVGIRRIAGSGDIKLDALVGGRLANNAHAYLTCSKDQKLGLTGHYDSPELGILGWARTALHGDQSFAFFSMTRNPVIDRANSPYTRGFAYGTAKVVGAQGIHPLVGPLPSYMAAGDYTVMAQAYQDTDVKLAQGLVGIPLLRRPGFTIGAGVGLQYEARLSPGGVWTTGWSPASEWVFEMAPLKEGFGKNLSLYAMVRQGGSDVSAGMGIAGRF